MLHLGTIRAFAGALTLLFIASCEGMDSSSTYRQYGVARETCQQRLVDPRLDILHGKTIVGVWPDDYPPPAMVTDNSYATDAELSALVLYDGFIDECSALYNSVGAPDGPAIRTWHTQRKQSIAALGRREITWGEYNRRMAAATARMREVEESEEAAESRPAFSLF